jgi:hypothetical protein
VLGVAEHRTQKRCRVRYAITTPRRSTARRSFTTVTPWSTHCWICPCRLGVAPGRLPVHPRLRRRTSRTSVTETSRNDTCDLHAERREDQRASDRAPDHTRRVVPSLATGGPMLLQAETPSGWSMLVAGDTGAVWCCEVLGLRPVWEWCATRTAAGRRRVTGGAYRASLADAEPGAGRDARAGVFSQDIGVPAARATFDLLSVQPGRSGNERGTFASLMATVGPRMVTRWLQIEVGQWADSRCGGAGRTGCTT